MIAGDCRHARIGGITRKQFGAIGKKARVGHTIVFENDRRFVGGKDGIEATFNACAQAQVLFGVVLRKGAWPVYRRSSGPRSSNLFSFSGVLRPWAIGNQDQLGRSVDTNGCQYLRRSRWAPMQNKRNWNLGQSVHGI